MFYPHFLPASSAGKYSFVLNSKVIVVGYQCVCQYDLGNVAKSGNREIDLVLTECKQG